MYWIAPVDAGTAMGNKESTVKAYTHHIVPTALVRWTAMARLMLTRRSVRYF